MSSVEFSPAARVLNASKHSLRKVSQIACPFYTSEVAVLNVDQNSLSTLVGVECYPKLIQLSACDNCLVRMEAVRWLGHLVTLNLQGNSIIEVAGLSNLAHLQWVNLAGNSIKSMDSFNSCSKLNHLDLSENCITDLSDISSLCSLKTLLLHGNVISSFQSVADCLPRSLATLSLAENEVTDLNEVCFLRDLPLLEQVSLLSNPCVSITESQVFDYRPYVLFWCPHLTVLDGMEVTSGEVQSSLSLFPPDKPYPFTLGEHHLLTHYLSSINPLKHIHYLSPASLKTGHVEQDKQLETSLVELQDLLSKSSHADQSGLTEKLKALQLVEELIMRQETLINTRRDDGYAPRAADELKAESAVTGVASANNYQLVGEGSLAKPPLEEQSRKKLKTSVLDIVAHDSEPGDGKAQVDSVSSKSPRGVSSLSSNKSLDERKKQQLKKINDKLAKRHSNIPRRETHSAKISARFDGYPGTNQKHSPEPELVQGKAGKGQRSASGNGLKDDGVLAQNLRISSPTTESLTATDVSLPSFTDESSTKDPLPATSNEDDLLNSESSFIPLPLNDSMQLQELAETTWADTFSSGPQTSDSQNTEVYISSLLSSLDQAYGYSTFLEKSKLLTSLVGPNGVSFDEEDAKFRASLLGEGGDRREPLLADSCHSTTSTHLSYDKKAVHIQSHYRGYITRKKFKILLQQNRAATRIQSAWLRNVL